MSSGYDQSKLSFPASNKVPSLHTHFLELNKITTAYRIEYSIIISTSPSSNQFFFFHIKIQFLKHFIAIEKMKCSRFDPFIWFTFLFRNFRSSDQYSMHNKRTIEKRKDIHTKRFSHPWLVAKIDWIVIMNSPNKPNHYAYVVQRTTWHMVNGKQYATSKQQAIKFKAISNDSINDARINSIILKWYVPTCYMLQVNCIRQE